MAGGYCNRCNKFLTSPITCDLPDCKSTQYHDAMQLRFPGGWPPKVYISVIGAVNAGKTYYLLALQDALIEKWNENRGLMRSYGIANIEMFDPVSNELVDDLLKVGKDHRLHYTNSGTPLGFFSLILTLNNNKVYEIVLFNSSGEKIEQEFKDKLFHTKSHEMKGSAVLYFVDPREDSGLNALLNGPKLKGTCRDYKIGSHIYNVFSLLNGRVGIVNNPLAICISKFDLLLHQTPTPVPQHPFIEANDENFSRNMNRVSEELKPLLREYSNTIDVADIDEKFMKVNYFAVAPFGNDAEPKWHQKEPKGILAPFIWVLKQLTIINE